MTSGLTTTSHAVLGLLAVRPWSTYELADQIDRSLGWFWPRTKRKIYDEAKRLVAHELAVATTEMTGRRPRTVYDITEAGREALEAWLAEPSADPKFEAEAVVRVFFADSGSLETLRATLTETAEAAEVRLVVLSAMTASMGDADYAFVSRRHINALTIRQGLDHYRMIGGWARWALDQTEQWASIDDPGDWDWRTALH